MKARKIGTIAVHTELVMTLVLAPSLRATRAQRAPTLIRDRLDEPTEVRLAVRRAREVDDREDADRDGRRAPHSTTDRHRIRCPSSAPP